MSPGSGREAGAQTKRLLAGGQCHPCPLFPGDLEAEEALPSGLPPTFIRFAHHSYAQMVRVLKRTAMRCAQVARTYSIGRSFDGKDLLVIEFSGRPGQHELSKCPGLGAGLGAASGEGLWAAGPWGHQLGERCLGFRGWMRLQGSAWRMATSPECVSLEPLGDGQ